MNKSIAIIGRFNKSGGTRTFFKSLLQYYDDKNIRILVFLEAEQLDFEIKSLMQKKRNIKLIIIPKYQLSKNLNLIATDLYIIMKLLMLRKMKIEKVVFTEWNLLKELSTLLIRYKTIYFVHSIPGKSFPKIFKPLLRLLFHNKKIITVSKFSTKQIINKWVGDQLSDKVNYLYNYASVPLAPMKNTKFLTITTVGHVRHYKNPALWLEIAEKITCSYNNVEFIWVGDGELLHHYQNKVKDKDRINFIGHTDFVCEIYQRTNIYMQLSKVESHGISVVDAMKYSLPCIVSKTGGLPESIEHQRNGFVVENSNVESIISYLKLLIDSKEMREGMGREGFKLYESKFTKEVWIQRMNSLDIF